MDLVKDFEGGGVCRVFGIAAVNLGEADAGASLVQLGNFVNAKTNTGFCRDALLACQTRGCV